MEKRTIVPMINVGHDEDDTGLVISIDLAGAPKDKVQLDMGKEGFCVKAEAENFRYESCYRLGHPVRPEEAKAKFESGLLTIRVPFEDLLAGRKVPIQ